MANEADSGSVVSIVGLLSMLGFVDIPELEPIANEAREHLVRVYNTLQHSTLVAQNGNISFVAVRRKLK